MACLVVYLTYNYGFWISKSHVNMDSALLTNQVVLLKENPFCKYLILCFDFQCCNARISMLITIKGQKFIILFYILKCKIIFSWRMASVVENQGKTREKN